MTKLTAMVAALMAMAVFAAVEWRADFDVNLATHIAAEISTNTTSVASGVKAVEPVPATSGHCEFGVKRIPPSGFLLIIH